MSVTLERQTIRLSFRDGDVLVTPEDEDRFILTAQRAVEACREVFARDTIVRRFKSTFLIPLRNWCIANRDQIRTCHLAPIRGQSLEVFVVGKEEEYDFDLTRRIAKLEIGLAHDGWVVHVMQVPDTPPEELSTFFDARESLEVYAELA